MHDDLTLGEVSVGSRCGAQTLSADALFGHGIRCLDDHLPGHRRRRPAVPMVPQPLLRALRPTGQVPKPSPDNNYPELSGVRIIQDNSGWARRLGPSQSRGWVTQAGPKDTWEPQWFLWSVDAAQCTCPLRQSISEPTSVDTSGKLSALPCALPSPE